MCSKVPRKPGPSLLIAIALTALLVLVPTANAQTDQGRIAGPVPGPGGRVLRPRGGDARHVTHHVAAAYSPRTTAALPSRTPA